MLALEYRYYFKYFMCTAIVFYILAVAMSSAFLFIGIAKNKSFPRQWGMIFLLSLIVVLYGFAPVIQKFLNVKNSDNITFFSDQSDFEDFFLLMLLNKKIIVVARNYYIQNHSLPSIDQIQIDDLSDSFDNLKNKYSFVLTSDKDSLYISAKPIDSKGETVKLSLPVTDSLKIRQSE